jgi:hypothetical protein
MASQPSAIEGLVGGFREYSETSNNRGPFLRLRNWHPPVNTVLFSQNSPKN